MARRTVLNEEAVLALAPDDASRIAARAVAHAPEWHACGTDGAVVWGAVVGAATYEVVAAHEGGAAPVLVCTCPSPKQPCKHALGLLLRLAWGQVPAGSLPSSIGSRLEQGRRRAGEPPPRARRSDEVVDVAAQVKRRERRAANVDAGVVELERWLDDLVAGGLATGRTRSHSAFDEAAARLVDAQAPGLAGRVRSLGGTIHGGAGWPDRTLAELGDLHLLLEAWHRLDRLPPDHAANVRTQIGFTTARADVLATTPVRDRWDVLGSVVIENPDLTSRRVWMRGETVGGWALLLDHVPAGGRFDVTATVGTAFEADVHRYPGAGTLRSLVGERYGEPRPITAVDGASVADVLAAHALALAANPFVLSSPVALGAVVPVDGDRWHVVDERGDALVLRGASWPLLALSAGSPVTVVGEWDGRTLAVLTCWADGALHLIGPR